MRSLLSRLSSRSAADKGGGGNVQLWINADDIQDIWARFPGLDPDQPESAGVYLLTPIVAAAIGAGLGQAAHRVSMTIQPLVTAMAESWATNNQSPWPAVAEGLVGGICLGCAVPRSVAWRRPSVLAVDLGDPAWVAPHAGRTDSHSQGSGGARRPPLLRLSYLAGSGRAGVALLTSSRWPAAQQLVEQASSREFGQVFGDYTGPDSSLANYGQAGTSLVRAGILRSERAGLQSRLAVAVPVITLGDFKRVAAAWSQLVAAAVKAIDEQRPEIERALTVAAGEGGAGSGSPAYPPPAGGSVTIEAVDLLDAAYFVLADLVYESLLDAGLASAGTGAPNRAPARALLLEDPAQVWEWLTTGTEVVKHPSQ